MKSLEMDRKKITRVLQKPRNLLDHAEKRRQQSLYD